jgi:hypothetical protein
VATVLIDATDATVSLALTAKKEAGPNRIVCDLNGVEDVREFDLSNRDVYGCNDYSALGRQSTTRHEGGATSSVTDVNKAYDNLGVARSFYQTNFGIDSFDGRGSQIRATVRACQSDILVPPYIYDYYCPYPNAFWDGQQLVFGQGYATDDVAAHEFTHAVIDHTSQLFYAYQSGAINEALADIMGEFADQGFNGPGEDTSKLWLIGEDLPLGPGATVPELRDMANPGRFGQPSTMSGLDYGSNEDNDNGGVHRNSGIGNHLAFLIAMGGQVGSEPYPGLGLEKSKLVWYRAMHLMPSGGDYLTLRRVLDQSCVELVGHFGFTSADCFTTLRGAVKETDLYGIPAPACYPGTFDPPLFADDFEFEDQDKWTFTPGWRRIPSPDLPVSYAASGKGALYGLAPSDGSVAYATTKSTMTIPVFPDVYETFLTHQLLAPALGYWGPVNGPVWEYDDVNDAAGWQPLATAHADHGGAYAGWFKDLRELEGKTVRLRVGVAAGMPDILIDDVRVASCKILHPSPFDVTFAWSGTTAVVDWKYYSYPQDHFEFSYDPPIPGAPATLPGLGLFQDGTPRSLTLTGLDPAKTYTMTITLVDDEHQRSARPVTVLLKTGLSPLCMTEPPLPFHLFSPTKPPSTDGGCGTAVVTPRRSG